jgi:hypothetical protein
MRFGEGRSDSVPVSEDFLERQARSNSGSNLVEGELEFTPAAAGAGLLATDSPRGKWSFPSGSFSG